MRRRPESDHDAEAERPSKTQVKQAMLDLQQLGVDLLELPLDQFAAIEMDERLREAFAELRRITAFSARKRQMQYVSKLLRAEDPEPFRRALAAHRAGKRRDAEALHAVERWRERILGSEDGLKAWLDAFPASDTSAFHSLLRNAHRELAESAAASRGAPQTKGKFYRALFQHIRRVMQDAASGATPPLA
ncbi:ribosome biogenesis factor YjgA [Fontimonas sp. SYSU GA230001]|uniref:ribosome biogenesis factor YjgA n=1 Tax=Fontimonas sp. SYSU GA230001 TaxID=3142450 RepID=UPI0032B50784